MRILVLSKRQYTGKDLLNDRYGRLFEIPAELSLLGHEIRGITLSYRARAEIEYSWQDFPNMLWESHNITSVKQYFKSLHKTSVTFKPDLIWASSDALHVIVAWLLSVSFNLPLFIDLYDNYESFKASHFPGVVPLLRRACRAAAGVTAVSETLSKWTYKNYKLKRPPEVIGNGVSADHFFRRDRNESRARLDLPQGARLIGTAGSITRNRGIDDLFEAFLILAKRDPDLWLALAGPRDRSMSSYRHNRIIDLGVLPLAEVPYFFSSLDVAIICNRDSAFGRYCFPQKLSEIVACETPFVAADVGEVARLLSTYPEDLYEPGRADILAEKIARKMSDSNERRDEALQDIRWSECAARLERYFLKYFLASSRN